MKLYDIFTSVWFNVVLALLACYFLIMQEVWGGNVLPYANQAAIGGLGAIGFSWAAEVIKKLIFEYAWSWKKVIIGAVAGIVLAFILALFV